MKIKYILIALFIVLISIQSVEAWTGSEAQSHCESNQGSYIYKTIPGTGNDACSPKACKWVYRPVDNPPATILCVSSSQVGIMACCECIDTTWSTWLPLSSTKCPGETVTQTRTSNCGTRQTKTIPGTKICPQGYTCENGACEATQPAAPPPCIDTTWSPDPSTICSGILFAQKSNCGNWRTATGTKICPQGYTCDIVNHVCIKEEEEVVEEIECTDSDVTTEYPGGKNPFIQGTTTGYDNNRDIRTFTDRCSSIGLVVEYTCTNEKTFLVYNIKCPFGYTCEDGACVKEVVEEPECTDTDGGLDYYTKGMTIFKTTDLTLTNPDECILVSMYDDGKPVGYNNVSSCDGDDCYVLEAFCKTDSRGNLLDADATEKFKCPNGCEDGACVKEVECTDTDGGLDYYLKGFMNSGQPDDAGHWDSCYNIDESREEAAAQHIIEYYCENNLPRKTEPYECLYGCEDGACVKEIECTDTDVTTEYPDGINYYLKGTTRGLLDGEPSSRTDHCGGINSEFLEEFHCEGNNIAYIHAYECLYGCEDGACIEHPKCEIGSRTSAEYCDIDQTQKPQKPVDETCINNFECITNICQEDICRAEDILLLLKQMEEEITQECTDSDSGKDYYTKGYVLGNGMRYDDKCAFGQEGNPETMDNPNLLFEAYCFEDGSSYGYDFYECPNGCEDGVCIEELPEEDEEGKKVVICHYPPENPENAHTIRVGQPAVDAHLAHGDILGPCPEEESQEGLRVDQDGNEIEDHYYDETGNLQPIKLANSYCTKDYECTSSICSVDDKCLDYEALRKAVCTHTDPSKLTGNKLALHKKFNCGKI